LLIDKLWDFSIESSIFIIDEGIDSLEDDGKIKMLELIREVLPDCILVICTHNWQSHIPINETVAISGGQIAPERVHPQNV
jgi:energy-coupling factor transporter ATP-binding protein EcfA2